MGGGGFLRLLVATLISTTAAQILSCDFEQDLCQWTQVTSDSLDWTRQQGATGTNGTGPSTDHTIRSGFYIYLETSNGTMGDNAQLQSPAVTVQNHKACLQFFYYMFGADVADLNVYTVQNNGTGDSTKIWTKHGSQGNKWNNGQVDINIGTNFVIVFEATRGASYLGDIAIDDVRIYTYGTCVIPQTACTFEEGNFCSLSQQSQGTFKWVVSQGSSTFTRQPIFDHTTGTRQGHYAFLDVSAANPGDAASLITPSMTDYGKRCLHFYYSMLGDYAGTLNVSLRSSNGYVSTLWSITDVSTPTWAANEIQLLQGLGTYQVVFQAVAGDQNSGGTFALDDITYSSRTCRSAGTCNFEEGDLCTWSNDDSDQFEWFVLQGMTASDYTGPVNDHTFGNRSGHYVYIDASNRQPGDIARLVSAFITNPQLTPCFSFMYSMNGKDIGTLNIYAKLSSTYNLMWTLSGNQNSSWMPGSFSLPQASYTHNVQIIIESVTTAGFRGGIALDDLKLGSPYCSVTPSTAQPPTAAVASRAVSAPTQAVFGASPESRSDLQAASYLLFDVTWKNRLLTLVKCGSLPLGRDFKNLCIDDVTFVDGECPFRCEALCDFEQDMCEYSQETTDDFDWTRASKLSLPSGTGPTFDHTLASTQGHYMYTEASALRKSGDRARIISPIYPGGGIECLQFYYYMHGSSGGSLNVYLQNANKTAQGSMIWNLNVDSGNQWLVAQASINRASPYQIEFEGIVGANSSSDVAIDDIQILPNPCPNPLSCDFEDGFCTFHNIIGDNSDWVLSSPQNHFYPPGTPTIDHTTGSSSGTFAAATLSSLFVGYLHATLASGLQPPTTGKCLRFAYSISGNGILQVNMNASTSNSTLLQLTNSGGKDTTGNWKLIEQNVISDVAYSVSFDAQQAQMSNVTVVIDDVQLLDAIC